MRILLVEDEKELSRALAKMLMTEGYDVDTVYDGADGLSFSLSGLYDLINAVSVEQCANLCHKFSRSIV